jgi:hypothetical protein
MIAEIVSKLNDHLTSGIRKEADVMYTLAEIRKILEQTGTTPAYPVLDFYTNWVVHSALDRHRWAWEGLGMIEKAVDGFQNGRSRSEEVLTAVTSVLSFQKLHSELLEFGRQYGIAFDKPSFEQWREFAVLLLDILIGCPLVTKSTTATVRSLALSRDFSFVHAGGQTLAFWKTISAHGRFITGPIF